MNLDDLKEQLADLSPAKRALLELRLKQKNRDSSIGPTIPRRTNQNSAPLSFGQQRLWFLNELEPSNPAYHISHAFRIKGALNVSALQAALNEVVRRHEVLRTRFAAVAGQAVQLIDEEGAVFLRLIDLSNSLGCEADIRRLAAEASKLPFDLSKGPLFRASLLRLGDDDHVLLTTIHHIISDGWSMRLLFREVSTLYDAIAQGRSSPLPDLPLQYADFALWQRELLESERGSTQLSYWQNKLEGVPAVLELPADRPRPAVNSFRGARKSSELSEGLTHALEELSSREGVTLFMTLLAAFKTLLWRYTRSDDIVVGVPIAGRNRPELEGLIGFFVNSLVLRTDLGGNPSFLDVLSRVRETTLEAYAHQDLPFEKLVEALHPERNPSQSPLFQVMLTLQHAPRGTLDLSGLRVEILDLENQTSKFDLTIFALTSDDRVKFIFEYNTDLFDEPRIDRMVGHFNRLLEGIVQKPDQLVSTLPLLTASEEQQLLVEWNETRRDYAHERSIPQLFEAQVMARPNAIAVVDEKEQLSYKELNRRANQVAHFLRRHGVGRESLVAVCLERSVGQVVALLGILKAGAAYVPLDPGYPEERLRFMLADAEVKVLITQQQRVKSLQQDELRVISVEQLYEEALAQDEVNPLHVTKAEDLAYVIYTSGSTGRPKGVEIEHRGLLNLINWHQESYDVTAEDRATLVASPAFDASVWELWPYLTAGASVYAVDEEARTSPGKLLAWLSNQKITVSFLPTPLAEAVLSEAIPAHLSLRALLTGGDLLHRGNWARLPFKLVNHYGPTESTVVATCGDVTEGEQRTPTIGRPIANTQVYILDEQMQLVPIGVVGEIYIGGIGLARGYRKRPQLTAEKFVRDPFSDDTKSRLYKTGDLARFLPSGEIEFVGRIDQQVKMRGFRIELGEIEAVLSEYPGVKVSAVVMRTDLPGGDGLVAYVVGETVNSKELRDYLRSELPDYMVPAVIVEMEELPLTTSGKIDRRALPAPQLLRLDLETQFEAPRTPVEEVVMGIWSEILNVDRIGIHDNFFRLGGHSLLAVQVISRIRAGLQIELPLSSFFESPTIAACAAKIEKGMREQAGLQQPPLVRASRAEDLPLSYAQQRLWFLDQLEQGSSFYHISRAFRFRGKLNVDALSAAINEIVRRHEPLRTSFVEVEGTPLQRINEPEPVPLPVLDLTFTPESDRDDEARRLASERIREAFDLSRGPLLRATLMRTGEEEWVFVVTIHHIAGDAWSLSVLFRELTVLYKAFAQEKPSPLPDLEIQFADFAAWQRSWLEGEMLEKHVSYWRQQLSGAPLVLELPADKPRPANQTFRGARSRFDLSRELTANVKKLSNREGVTPFMTFLAAFQLLLSRYTGQTDLLVGTDVANRNRVETEAMIGFFVNVLPLRVNLSENPSFTELLKQVRETTLRAYAHQDVPFERLVAELKPKRDLSRNPLVQTLLVMQNTPAQELEIEGASVTPFEMPSETSRFDLALFLTERGDSFSGTYLYNPDLFDPQTIERMSGHYETLLRSILEDPSARIDTFRMKTEEELLQEEVEKRERQQLQIHSLRDTRRRGVEI